MTAVAGTTIRLGFINGANVDGHEVIGLDNVQLILPPPTVTLVAPACGSTNGGNSVTITGTNFSEVTGVTFGGVAATDVMVVSGSSITATVPPGGQGPVSVVVTAASGSNEANDLYAYEAPILPIATMNTWGMILFMVLLGIASVHYLRRRRSVI
ncbi:MAG TPA: IPT/TIG domain-containing protein [Syntrophales bacterium]|nr:IPT/TIG domain-containing protein [Syntrophales bacterium]